MLRKILLFFLVVGLLLSIGLAGFLTWGYYYINRDLPKLSSIEDYRPPAVSRVFASDGTLIAEFYRERRYPVKLKDVPLIVRNAFLASEDANFYTHGGIDPVSIIRAFVKNIESGSMSQGGSTITQQVVKNLLLTPEKKLMRKLKEALLSWQIEKRFSKDEIFEMYLNQIFFGNFAYGIKAAGKLYFGKELKDLTISEASMLAGLPKAPSKFSPFLNPTRARRRQKYVLGQMVKAGFITEEQAKEAEEEKLRVLAPSQENIYQAPYYASEVRRIFTESDQWKNENVDTAGFDIYTALDLNAERFAEKALRKGLREVDKRRGWRGPVASLGTANTAQFKKEFAGHLAEKIEPGAVYPAMITEISVTTGVAKVTLGDFFGSVNVKDAGWAKKRIDREDRPSFIRPELLLRAGDVVEVSVANEASPNTTEPENLPPGMLGGLVLDQTPEIEGAITLIDPNSGKVVALVGGYSYQRSVFNRATQGLRQPGSSFKPILYLSAVDGFKYTPATIVYDAPRTFKVGDEYWTPANFDEKFLGAITLRVALEKSRNLVSADIVSRIGIDPVIQYARKLGITSPLGRNLSLSLGSSEVTLLELTRAYGVLAAKGVLFDSVFVTKVLDRDGKVLYDHESDRLSKAKQAISEDSAFIMSYMMKGVVEHGTGVKVKELGRPVAGKTGTSNEEMDTWFIGFTPKWVAGVWTGFDQKKRIGEKETGGRVAAPIFLYFMRDFLNYEDNLTYSKLVEETKLEAERLGIEHVPPPPLEPLDFSVPDGVDPYWVDKATGRAAEPSSPGAILEYFIKGTEPSKTADGEEETGSYLESPDL